MAAQPDIRLRFPNEQRKDAARWQYKVIYAKSENLEGQINALAAEGWEVHTFAQDCALLRRDATGAEFDEPQRSALLKEIAGAGR
mgnify:CR=1 FL=1